MITLKLTKEEATAIIRVIKHQQLFFKGINLYTALDKGLIKQDDISYITNIEHVKSIIKEELKEVSR